MLFLKDVFDIQLNTCFLCAWERSEWGHIGHESFYFVVLGGCLFGETSVVSERDLFYIHCI